jgi:UDP-N-acetylmuramyl pentapeptide phosphotransferase/UDP-N-acetylglucosamine-1-phosphate transferase
MPSYLNDLLLIAVTFATSLCMLKWLFPRLQSVLDTPNARSSHSVPTPKGGGIAVIGASLLWMTWAQLPGAVLLGAIVLAIVSWREDTKGVSPQARLIWQFLMICFAWPAIYYFGAAWGISKWIALPLGVLVWIGYTNLTNFMDGIDGITAMQTISIALGMLLVYIVSPHFHVTLAVYALMLAAACAAFLKYNRPPAKLFLGDVGSIPLGFLTGWLLLALAIAGYPAAAVILPAYYLADGGLTLFFRWRRGAKLTQAHAEHFYQQAVQGGKTHAQVVRSIAKLNVALALLAAASTLGPLAGIPCIVLAYALTYAQLQRFRKTPSVTETNAI